MFTVSGEPNANCDPLYGRVDALLEQLTKSKSLHILMILDQKNRPLRFSEIKDRVDASSTTVSRRLGELIEFELVERTKTREESKTHEYAISEYGKQLSPIMHAFYDWVKRRDSAWFTANCSHLLGGCDQSTMLQYGLHRWFHRA